MFSAQGEALLEAFLADRRARSLSERTISFYAHYVGRFVSACDSPHDLPYFLNSLSCSPGGKHAYYRAIRTFLVWAYEEGYLETLPRFRPPKVPKPLRYAVSIDDIPTLLGNCTCTRDELIVTLLADTGLRVSELASIRVVDVHLESETIRVWGKGAKERIVRYGPTTRGVLGRYVTEEQLSDRLFDLTADGIRLVLARLERRTGIKCNAHAFRRTFACQSVRNGMNLFYVQSLLGHSTLTMTRIYAEQVNSEDAIKAYKPIVQ
jgi:integrase